MKTIQQKFLAHCRSSCNVKIEKNKKSYYQHQVIESELKTQKGLTNPPQTKFAMFFGILFILTESWIHHLDVISWIWAERYYD